MTQKYIPRTVSIVDSCASMMNLNCPVVGMTTNPTYHHQIVDTTKDPMNHMSFLGEMGGG